MNIFTKCLELNTKYKYLIFFIEIIHLIIAIFTAVSIFLPQKLLPFGFLLISIILIGWEFFDGRCWITILANNLVDKDKDKEIKYFIKLSRKILKLWMKINLMLIIFFHMKPQYSFFTLLGKIFRFLEKYN